MFDYIVLLLGFLLENLVLLVFFGIPLASLVVFIVSLYRYIAARRRNKGRPDSIEAGRMKELRLQLVTSAIVAGVFAVVMITLMVLLSKALVNM